MFRLLIRNIAGVLCALTLSVPSFAQVLYPPGTSLNVPSGATIDIACLSLDMQGTLNFATGGTFTTGSSASFGAVATVTGTTGTMNVGGNLSTAGPLNFGNNSLVMQDGCLPGNTSQISGNITVQNLTIRSTTGRTFILPAGANITVLGTLTLQGTPGLPVQLVSSGATAIINLGPSATVVRSDASVSGTVQIGAAIAASNIPTLSEYGMILLALALVLCTLTIPVLRRQP